MCIYKCMKIYIYKLRRLKIYWYFIEIQYAQKLLDSWLVSGIFFPENNWNSAGHCYVKVCLAKAVVFYYHNAEGSYYISFVNFRLITFTGWYRVWILHLLFSSPTINTWIFLLSGKCFFSVLQPRVTDALFSYHFKSLK